MTALWMCYHQVGNKINQQKADARRSLTTCDGGTTTTFTVVTLWYWNSQFLCVVSWHCGMPVARLALRHKSTPLEYFFCLRCGVVVRRTLAVAAECLVRDDAADASFRRSSCGG